MKSSMNEMFALPIMGVQTNCQTSFDGLAYFDEGGRFLFAPEETVPGRTARFRARGVAQQMSDGTFDFVPERQMRAQTRLLKKLAHGRLSEMKNGSVRLTLTVTPEEMRDMKEIIIKESNESIKKTL